MRFRHSVLGATTSLLLFLQALSVAKADIFFDTITNPIDPTIQNMFGPNYPGTGGESFYFAQKFVTGTSASNTITSLGLLLAQDSTQPTSGTYNVSIYTNDFFSGQVPGTFVANVGTGDASLLPALTTPTFPPTFPATTMFNGLSISLDPSTSYMVVVNPNNLGANWMYWYRALNGYQNYGNPESPQYAGDSYSPTTATYQFGTWNGGNQSPFYMQINAVPEPSTYAMALAGLACGGFSVLRRRRNPTGTKSGRCKAVARASAIVATCMTCFLMRSADAVPTLADISWGSATNISGDSDVDTIGTLVYAYNFGSGTSATTQTINGVTFQPFVIPNTNIDSVTTGSVTVSENSGYLASDFDLGSGTTPFSGLSSDYRSLLSSEVYASNFATMKVDLGGLTPGNSYRLQWWTNDSALPTAFGSTLYFENMIASGSSAIVTLDSNTSGVNGGLGQYVIGTFTASNATESFTLTGSGTGGVNFPMMNALQLRTVAVPEPATCIMALTGLACGGFSMWRRRKQA